MYTLIRIRKLVHHITVDQLFTTRQCLSFGSRGAVDQALYLMVKTGEIIRVARGVFMKKGSEAPTALAVAKIKAESFGRRIFVHGADAACELGFPVEANESPTFACTGRSSSFRFGKLVIKFKGSSPRKLHERDTLAGKVIGALWHLGKERATPDLISQTYPQWSKSCHEIEAAAGLLPEWMNNLFHWGRTGSRAGGKYSSVPNFNVDWGKVFPEFADLFKFPYQAT